MRRLNLTLAGNGGSNSGSSGASGGFGGLFGSVATSFLNASKNKQLPPPPAAPTPAAASKPTGAVRTGAENIRNQGGARGLSTANTMRALKQLTGQ